MKIVKFCFENLQNLKQLPLSHPPLHTHTHFCKNGNRSLLGEKSVGSAEHPMMTLPRRLNSLSTMAATRDWSVFLLQWGRTDSKNLRIRIYRNQNQIKLINLALEIITCIIYWVVKKIEKDSSLWNAKLLNLAEMVLDFSLFKFLIHCISKNIFKNNFFYLFAFNILDLKSLKLFLSS